MPRRGQAMVEMALVFPLFAVLVGGAVDAGRLGYTLSMVNISAAVTARAAAVTGGQSTDCTALTAGTTSPGVVTFNVDPHSYYVAALAQPASTVAASIPLNTGDVYIFPAVAPNPPSIPGPATCAGASRQASTGGVHMVQVTVTYRWQAWVPVPIALSHQTLTANAEVATEY